MAFVLLIGSGLQTPEYMRYGLMFAGMSLIAAAALIRLLAARHARAATRLRAQVLALVAEDVAPTFGTDAEGRVEFQNRAAETRFGTQGGQTIVRAMKDLFANPSAVLYRLQSRAANAGQASEDVVTRRGHVRLSVHRIAQGRYLWRLEEVIDKLGASRGGEALSLPMLIASKSGAILFMNEALRRILGARPKSLDRVFVRLPLHSGEEAELSGADGPLRAIVAEVEGPGERREIYLLPTSEEAPRHEALGFEDLPVALGRVGGDGQLAGANRMARELLGLDESETAGFQDLVEGLGRPVADWVDDVLAGRGSNRSEVLRATRAEEDRYLQITLRRTVEMGRPGVVVVLNDATELKTLEAQFVQSQKMQAIGQLAGGVAHDFNNLLTAISGHCDLLLLRHEKGDPDYGDLVQIHQNANRAASLVGQLLAFSRKQTLKPEVVDLREALSDLTHLLNRLVGEKVTLSLSHDVGLRAVRADRRQLEQVLMNLVVNARDAMPEGGAIWIETENRHLDVELVRDRATVPVGDYVVVRVRDEGIGITPEALAKIFEPFYTTKRTGEGTGLGLSTAYGIIKQTGGFIFADSVVGAGTTFTLYFPAHDLAAAMPALAPQIEAPVAQAHGGVVLLVEDEAPVRAFASRALRMRGYTVLEAESAEEALEVLQDPDLAVDVFVTDVIMPGMDGPSWVREALKARPDTRVVFVSGYAEDSFADSQARIPNSVFLPKPFSLTDLTRTVQRQIH
ncbi:hybrid sensor histidine kinase/response regulator [Acidimangrovimonas sediminis]|uniref:hybrid sensor histidine kinase/response regulator n=1 Tax=Acidimangrovimonas sediminis TaxID=2056283 RepID=UPI000C7F95D1